MRYLNRQMTQKHYKAVTTSALQQLSRQKPGWKYSVKTFPTEPGIHTWVSDLPTAKQIESKVCTERSCFDVYSLRQHHGDESPEHPRNVSHHLVHGTFTMPAGTRIWGHIIYPRTGLTHNQLSSLKTVSPNVLKFTTVAWSCKPYLLAHWLPWDTSSQFGTSKTLVFSIS